MAGIDSALGVSQQVLAIRAERMKLLASNIANTDTPNYKARDIDFRAAMDSALEERGMRQTTHLKISDDQHIDASSSLLENQVKYRVPSQLNLNGNTVESHREHAEFMDNAMKYQASLNLLDSRIKGLMSAIKGGQ